MSELTEVSVSAVTSADLHLSPIGPLESRRARRERIEAATALQASLLDDDEYELPQEPPARTTVVFSDELAVARQRRLIAIASAEDPALSSQDWGS